MPWAEFDRAWDHRPHPSRVVAYPKGYRGNLAQAVFDAALNPEQKRGAAARAIKHPDDLKSTKTRNGGVKAVKPTPAAAATKEN